MLVFASTLVSISVLFPILALADDLDSVGTTDVVANNDQTIKLFKQTTTPQTISVEWRNYLTVSAGQVMCWVSAVSKDGSVTEGSDGVSLTGVLRRSPGLGEAYTWSGNYQTPKLKPGVYDVETGCAHDDAVFPGDPKTVTVTVDAEKTGTVSQKVQCVEGKVSDWTGWAKAAANVIRKQWKEVLFDGADWALDPFGFSAATDEACKRASGH